MSPGDIILLLDFILNDQKFRNSVHLSKAISCADVGSDHNPMTWGMSVIPKTPKKTKTIPKT